MEAPTTASVSKWPYWVGSTLFASVLLIHLPDMFQGIDLTDYGFHLTNQAAAFPVPPAEPAFPMFFLSDFVGGLWLEIIGRPSLLWAKFGGLLIVGLCALISYKTLTTYFDRRRTWLAVFASSLMVTMNWFCYLIDYYTFPSLLICLLLYSLNRVLHAPPSSRPFLFYAFLLGFLAVALILARFTLVTIALLPLILAAHHAFKPEHCTGFTLRRSLPYVGLGIISALLLSGFLYQVTGVLKPYMSTVISALSDASTGTPSSAYGSNYGFGILFLRWGWNQFQALGRFVFFAVVLFALARLRNKFRHKATDALIAVLLLALLVLLLSQLGPREAGRAIISVIPIISLVFMFLVLRSCKSAKPGLSILFLAGVILLFMSPIGSDTGLVKSLYGMWIPLPFMMLIIWDLKSGAEGGWLEQIVSTGRLLLWPLILVALSIQFANVYRDSPNRLLLNTGFTDPGLRGIYSTEARSKAVDEALKEIKLRTSSNDVILTVNSIPMFYYLTETRPLFGTPWPCNSCSELELAVNYERVCAQGLYPKLIICAKTDTQSRDWPNDRFTRWGDLSKVEYLMSKYVRELGYQLVWENNLCALYVPPGKR